MAVNETFVLPAGISRVKRDTFVKKDIVRPVYFLATSASLLAVWS